MQILHAHRYTLLWALSTEKLCPVQAQAGHTGLTQRCLLWVLYGAGQQPAGLAILPLQHVQTPVHGYPSTNSLQRRSAWWHTTMRGAIQDTWPGSPAALSWVLLDAAHLFYCPQ